MVFHMTSDPLRVRLQAARQSAGALALTLGRSLRLIWQADRRRASAYLLLTVGQGLIPVAAAWLAKQVLDRVGAVLALHRNGTIPDAVTVNSVMVVAAASVAVQFAARFLRPIHRQLQGNLLTRVNGHILRQMMVMGGDIPDLDHFERKAFHDELSLLEREVSWRPKTLMGWLHSIGMATLTLAGSLVLLWSLQPLLPLALMACGIPQIFAENRQQTRVYRSITDRSESARMMAYCASLATDAGAAKELLVYGVGPWFVARWRRLAGAALTEMARVRRAGLRLALAIVGGNGIALALGFAYIASQVGSSRLTVGDFALYLSLVAVLQDNLSALTTGVGSTIGTLRFMARLFSFLYETRPSISVAPPEVAVPVPSRLRNGIELRRVGFAYPGQEQQVLSDVTCTLRAGETVALVGANGTGKTTLVKLLTRLYDPTGGEILLDGLPIAAYDLPSLRGRISALFQDFAHFALSAQHNVGVGDVGHADDRERVLAASRWAGADAVLEKLPAGWDTPLTRAFAGGVDLSGGEWQKVATARAAMREAALVVLDEPTAALDAQAEHELFTRFRQLAEGRTVLLISHRFSTVRMADRVLVLEGGRIVEAGSHAELTALGGRYAALYELQAGRYRD